MRSLVEYVRVAIFVPSQLFVGQASQASAVDTARRNVRVGLEFATTLVLLALPTAFRAAGGDARWGSPATWSALVPDILVNRFWFVLMLTVVLAGVYHGILVLSGRSSGPLSSFRILTRGPGLYLGVAYMAHFRLPFGNGLGLSDAGFPILRIDPAAVAGVREFIWVLVFAAAVGYLGYTLYVGAREVHRAGRPTATVCSATAMVIVAWLFSYARVAGQLDWIVRPLL